MMLADPIYRLMHWLKEHRIDEGVRVVLSFPDRQAYAKAEATLFKEVSPLFTTAADPRNFSVDSFQLCGLDIRFESREKRWPGHASLDVLEGALAFYAGSPDGQYDDEVVVPLLKDAIARHKRGDK